MNSSSGDCGSSSGGGGGSRSSSCSSRSNSGRGISRRIVCTIMYFPSICLSLFEKVFPQID